MSKLFLNVTAWNRNSCDFTGNFVWPSPPPRKQILPTPLRYTIYDIFVYCIHYSSRDVSLFSTWCTAHRNWYSIQYKYRLYYSVECWLMLSATTCMIIGSKSHVRDAHASAVAVSSKLAPDVAGATNGGCKRDGHMGGVT